MVAGQLDYRLIRRKKIRCQKPQLLNAKSCQLLRLKEKGLLSARHFEPLFNNHAAMPPLMLIAADTKTRLAGFCHAVLS